MNRRPRQMIGFFLLHVITIYVKEITVAAGDDSDGRRDHPRAFISFQFCFVVLLCGIISNAVSSVCAS